MGQIKSAFEIAIEKSKKIHKLSHEEIEEINQLKIADQFLAQYYKENMDENEIGKYLKNISQEYLDRIQLNFLQSLFLKSNEYDFNKRYIGIVTVEKLKKKSKLHEIIKNLKELSEIQGEFQQKNNKIIQDLRKDFESNPQKKFQTFQQGNQIMIKEITEEEFFGQNQELKKTLIDIEIQYTKKFESSKKKLNHLLNN